MNKFSTKSKLVGLLAGLFLVGTSLAVHNEINRKPDEKYTLSLNCSDEYLMVSVEKYDARFLSPANFYMRLYDSHGSEAITRGSINRVLPLSESEDFGKVDELIKYKRSPAATGSFPFKTASLDYYTHIFLKAEQQHRKGKF